jgi:hypothetical protein
VLRVEVGPLIRAREVGSTQLLDLTDGGSRTGAREL